MSPKGIPGFRLSVRQSLRAEYHELHGSGGYRVLGDIWGISTGVAHSLCTKDNYWPSDHGIQLALEAAARSRGIAVRRRGRKSDLWSMDIDVLLWKIINREEV